MGKIPHQVQTIVLRIIHVGILLLAVGECRGTRRREEVTLGKFSLENAGLHGVWGKALSWLEALVNGMPISSAWNLRAQALQHEYNDFFYTVVNGREGKRGGPDFNVVQRLIFLLYSGSILTKSNSRFTCSNSPSTAGTGKGLSDSFDIGAGEDLAAEDSL